MLAISLVAAQAQAQAFSINLEGTAQDFAIGDCSEPPLDGWTALEAAATDAALRTAPEQCVDSLYPREAHWRFNPSCQVVRQMIAVYEVHAERLFLCVPRG